MSLAVVVCMRARCVCLALRCQLVFQFFLSAVAASQCKGNRPGGAQYPCPNASC